MEVAFKDLLSNIVDNRGRTCPTVEDGFPLIATNCVKNSTLYPTFEKVRFVDKSTYDNWFRGHPIPGDLVFVTKGSPGKVCMVPDPVPFCIAQDMVAVRADPSKVYPPYLFAALRSQVMQDRIFNMHVGTMIPHFKKGDFDKLYIPIPELERQEFIGEWYLTISKMIESNRRTNETLEAMAQTIFRDWFVDFGPTRRKLEGATDPVAILRCLTPDPEKAALLAPLFPATLADNGLPEGWEHTHTAEFMEILDSKRIPMSARERAERVGPYPYHGATGVMGYVDDYLFDDTLLLLGEDGSVVRPSGKPFTQYVWGKLWVNNHAHVLKGKRISTEQLKVFFDQVNIAPFVTGAVQPKLNQKNMKAVPFVSARADVHAAFDELIFPLFEKYGTGKKKTKL